MRIFYHFLATELGMTVRELLSRLGADEIIDWMAYYDIKNERSEAETNKNFRANFEKKVNG